MPKEKDQTLTQSIVRKVESELDVVFEPDEIAATERFTWRKIEANGKGADYFPVLFENELRDLLMRQTINLLGQLNRCKKCQRISCPEAAVAFA